MKNNLHQIYLSNIIDYFIHSLLECNETIILDNKVIYGLLKWKNILSPLNLKYDIINIRTNI